MSRWMFEMLPEGAFEPRPGGGMRLHGGKGSSPPAPDPKLVQAQIDSLDTQNEMINRYLKLSEDMQPLQKEQMRFGLDSAKQAYEQAQDDRRFMMDRRGQLSGLQDRLVRDAKEFNADDRANQLAGQAITDVQQATAASRGQNNRALAAAGVDPNSGRALAMNNSVAIAQAANIAAAAAQARQGARQEGYTLTDRASNALSGYPTLGMQSTNHAANYGGLGMNLVNQGMQGMGGAFTGAAGMASTMGQNATNSYTAQWNAYNTAQQSQAGLWGGLGQAAGMWLGKRFP